MQLSGNDVDLNEARMARANTPDWLARISKEVDKERGCVVPDSPTLKDFLGSSQTGVKLCERESSESTYVMPESTYVLPNSTYVPPEIGGTGAKKQGWRGGTGVSGKARGYIGDSLEGGHERI
jgi:hypothetical protein